MQSRQQLVDGRRWVVKIGSSLLTNDGRGLDREAIDVWADQLANLARQGLDVLLVSSGAVAEGMVRLGLSQRPAGIHELQAAAAVGQMGLVQAWESSFQRHGLHTAQVLVTHDDLSNRMRYLNARTTLRSLLKMGIVPVINENDTVVTDEIRFGDNDTLAALVTNLVEAEGLVILTDQAGMYDADPRSNPDASLLRQVRAGDADLARLATGSTGGLGRGGMITKVRSAEIAARSGAVTVIGHGREPDILLRLRRGEEIGTLFVPEQEPLVARKRWLAGHLQTRGTLVLDAGAVRVLREQGRSLLAVGVKSVTGSFLRGELVACRDAEGREVARGLVNYSAEETGRILGQPSERIRDILGYVAEPELIHRDNLVLV